MKFVLSSPLKQFASRFPVPLYVVGGFVRDGLDDIVSKDIDICSSLPCEDVAVFASSEGYKVDLIKKDTGTVGIKANGETWQYTSFRKDIYKEGHTPTKTLPATMEEDAKRRDFKCNAIYYDICNEQLIDFLGGIKDVKNKVLSATRPPEEVFSEDGLRLMRLARLSAETGFSIEKNTLVGARNNAFRIREIAPERIRQELTRILQADTVRHIQGTHVKGIRVLDEIGVLEIILPELTLGKKMEQRKDYHKYDVYEHILATLEVSDISVRLPALLHDIAKPTLFIETGKYHGHDIQGGVLAEKIMTRLMYPKKEIEETKRLITWHMLDLDGNMRENKIRCFVQQNADILEQLCLLKNADRIGSGYFTEGEAPASIRLRNTFEEMKTQKVPFSVKELLVNGKDLPSEEILPKNKRQEALQSLLRACSQKNTRYLTREKQLLFLQRYAKGRN